MSYVKEFATGVRQVVTLGGFIDDDALIAAGGGAVCLAVLVVAAPGAACTSCVAGGAMAGGLAGVAGQKLARAVRPRLITDAAS